METETLSLVHFWFGELCIHNEEVLGVVGSWKGGGGGVGGLDVGRSVMMSFFFLLGANRKARTSLSLQSVFSSRDLWHWEISHTHDLEGLAVRGTSLC